MAATHRNHLSPRDSSWVPATREKEMMATLREVSHVGEYIGEGRGDITDDDNNIDAGMYCIV